MINIYYKNDIINALASIITYGLENHYSYKSIEERICRTALINDLENNNFDLNVNNIERINACYQVDFIESINISFKAFFIAESYLNLFYCYKRSFAYLFLYWPLDQFVDKYGLYHEMDFSNLKNDFEGEIKKTTLLTKLCKNKKIKLSEISKLTGININSLNKYKKSDTNLFGASYDTIHLLSLLFEIKENIFLADIGAYLDINIFLYDDYYQDYRNFLGMFYANYYDNRIKENEFIYDKTQHIFANKKNGMKLIVLCGDKAALSNYKNYVTYDEKTYLVLIPTGFYYHQSDDYAFLLNTKVIDALIVTQENIYLVKAHKQVEINETVYRSLIIRSNRTN